MKKENSTPIRVAEQLSPETLQVFVYDEIKVEEGTKTLVYEPILSYFASEKVPLHSFSIVCGGMYARPPTGLFRMFNVGMTCLPAFGE